MNIIKKTRIVEKCFLLPDLSLILEGRALGYNKALCFFSIFSLIFDTKKTNNC